MKRFKNRIMVNNEHRIRKYCSFKGIVLSFCGLILNTPVQLPCFIREKLTITPILQLGDPLSFYQRTFWVLLVKPPPLAVVVDYYMLNFIEITLNLPS